jgi:CPA1 family monovalent cation:H+ antiporter
MFVAGGLAKSFGERAVIAWSGMRGAVSLAAALSVPLNAPGRPLILYLTFAVILGTLVGQGLTLPAVVRRLAPEDTGDAIHAEENARAEATRAALDRLTEIEQDGSDVPEEALDAARRRYELRLRHFTSDAESEPGSAPLNEARDVQEDLAETEREAIQQMHADGGIDLETARRLERELDLQEERWAQLRRSPLR